MPVINRIASAAAKGYGFLLSAAEQGFNVFNLTESSGVFPNNIKVGTSSSSYTFSTSTSRRLYALTFSADGLKCYFGYNVSFSGNTNLGAYTVRTLDLLNPYDLTGATTSGSDITNIGVNGGIIDFKFNGDGTEFIVSNQWYDSTIPAYVDEFYVYTLSTPYDLSTRGSATVYSTGVGTGFCFNSDGTKLYSTGLDFVYEYTLPAPYDVSSRTFSAVASRIYIPGSSVFAEHVNFNSDGTQLYILDTNNNLVTYTLTTGFDLSTITNLSRVQLSVEFLGSYAAGFFITPTNDRFVYLQSYPYGSSGNRAIISISINTSVCELPIWIWPSGFGDSSSTDYAYQNLWAASFRIRGGQFKDDGTKAYFMGYYNTPSPDETSIWEVDLPTPYDLRSITPAQIPTTYTELSPALVAFGSSTTGLSFRFSPDGTKLFVTAGTTLYSFALSSAWDLTSLSYVANITLVTQSYIRFKPDGTQMFAIESGGLVTYDFGTPWDVTTLSSVRTLSLSGDVAFAFDFSGKYLAVYNSSAVSGTDSISQYFLTTPFDTNTANLEGTVSLASLGTLLPSNINMVRNVALRFFEWDNTGSTLSIVASIDNVNYSRYVTARVFEKT